ncbi:oxidoreductase [Streptomyces sp. AcH 505]|uniref:zinc-binding dehydrogenase n=1 Tax=Streptomyces sp. AcH 505 TaxID=352211 RepID=UPI0005922266|nr:oxidoreductase [Streptomyces sp. AcH 505]
MHAIVLHAFGPAENLRYERTDDPVPAPGQVRIAVAVAGVHLLDTALRQGMAGPGPRPVPTELPTIPGREVAGTVDALGEGVDASWLGKRVVVHLGMVPGGYAELAVCDVTRLHAVPDGLDEAEAVAMIGTGRTTLGILQFTDLGPDSTVVVTAAAGGIGTLLVQYAKNVGATVVGLAGGPAKVAKVAANGADLAVDYTAPDWAAQVKNFLRAGEGNGENDRKGATIVYDSVGGPTALAAVDLLATGGQHVVFGWSGQGIQDGQPLAFTADDLAARGITSRNVLGPPMVQKAGGDLRVLEARALADAAAGRVRPAVQRFPLAEAALAHRSLETRATTGKVVLEPGRSRSRA